ncbi:IgGFc-binding protein-like [Stegostoma tigrinum]|uniref:IgGFc-binding protein-like n=1 Tax=Stegostoma tigrinum TaxID=3053191 RepID=UPI002870B341|nr:IgGFc-binding protein-like [Stegostoma tigrinum]
MARFMFLVPIIVQLQFLQVVTALKSKEDLSHSERSLNIWIPGADYITRCDFNNNSRPFCDWIQTCEGDSGNWIRNKHATPTLGTGPNGDYPNEDGFFIYQEASNFAPSGFIRLESKEISVSGEICIDFWYHMMGSEDQNELKVLVADRTTETEVWSERGNQGPSWLYASKTVKFPTKSSIQVIFEAIRGETEYGDTAIDNVAVRRGNCDSDCALNCNFDLDLCSWTQSKKDDLDWKRISGSTPSAVTGPSYDHTSTGGYYMYIEGNEGREGDKAQLVSAPCNKTGDQCLRFWYHMYGVARSMALNVYQLEVGQPPVLMWSERGNKGNQWLEGAVELHLSGKAQIMIEAMRGNDYRSDVAVDDISFHSGCCGDNCDLTSTTSTPTPTSTTPPVTTESTCSVQGDPHYKTFDKQSHNFMGTCTYTLSKLCDASSVLPYFNVEAANEHRSGNPYVSYVKHVNVNVYNHSIVLEKGHVVKVDGEVEVLPVRVMSGVDVVLSGKYVVVSTDFGLRVKFDGRHRADVTLPSVFKGKVCGMCGNYNDDRRDDFLNPDRVMEPDSVSLGNSWQSGNDTRCVPDVGTRPDCTDDERQMIESKSYCGIIVDPDSPFKACHSVVEPMAYFADCVYDLCALDLQTGSLCSSLQSYADACQSKGVRVEAWRNATFCPLKCGLNSHYEQCGSACPATCVNPNAPSSCSEPCVEGCLCDSGYVLYNDKCVRRDECGCWSEGKHYPVGSTFWTDDTCSTRCRCPSAGSKLVCWSTTCGTDSYCGVVNGVPGCYEQTYGICRVHNDPHYNTFDKATHHFMGTCTYTIAKLCTNSSSLPYFNIEAKNENRGNAKVSYVQRVRVAVHGHSIWIVKEECHRVLVDGVWATLPVTLVDGRVRVSRSGKYVVLETDFGLAVSYDVDHSVEVKVPSTYSNQICGMCGNYNGMIKDDYMKPDGEQAKDSNELGNSWKVPPDAPGCDPVTPERCEPAEEKLYQSDAFCGLITSQQGPFAPCHSVINPDGAFESCVVELCLLAGSQDALCGSVETYADACQSAGVTIAPWRNSTFCAFHCAANSHYKQCASACPATCTDRFAPENCSKPCVEDCACNAGFVVSGSTCVPFENCGCVHNNKYNEKGAIFWEEGCQQRCRCTGNNRVVCETASCGAEEICKVQDGNLGCYRADTAKCHIYGDPHYTTFDGKLYHFQGACNYTVTETCGNTSVRFSVTSRNEHRGNPAWSAINSIALQFPDIHIAVRKNNLVYVDGVKVELPVRPHSSVNVKMEGSFVTVQTDFGVQLRFNGDHELFVVVDERYKGQLCGLCGTYTDDPLDDFLKPDGILAMDSTQFGNSWAVIDDDWPCNQSPPPPATCDPAAKEEAEEYCKIILAGSGPFKDCHWYIPPQLYFESCVYDHCASGGDSVLLCNALGAYASACETAGVVLGDWMEQSGCVENSCGLGCNFDSDLCTWTQSKTDDLDWKRISGSTPSAVTGPSYDHTSAGGYYIYIEGNEGREGDKAQLVSAPCNKTGDQCLRFWYHMYGVARSMALNVYQLEVGQPPVLMWSERGNKGNQWLEGAVELHLSGKAQIMIEAVRGNDYRSDVAVDDISFQSGCCGDNCDLTSTTSTPTPTSTTPPVTTESTCSVQGDPHYKTFDKQSHNFMGTCTYTLSKLCDASSALPYFNVEAANEHRSGNPYVSYVKHVNVNVYNHSIVLEKGHVVKVDGEVEVLPVRVMSGVDVVLSGKYVVVSTDFGLRVKFDGRHRADVTLPSVFKGKVCGMCGNYNDDRRDDFLNPDGVMEPDSVSLGNSWQSGNDTRCVPDVGTRPDCTDDERQMIESKSYCGIIVDPDSPFKACHSVVEPMAYFADCVYDLCALDLQTGSLCSSLQSYADACQSKGVRVEAWRNATFCPLKCGLNSHYEQCGSACPATCVNPNAPSSCSEPCVEGCLCDSGYVLYNDRCVRRDECGCWSEGKHYPVGSTFWTDDTCSTRCRCPSAGSKLVCWSTTCGTDSYCGVVNGVPGCYEQTYGICRVHNDPHYNTFDKATHHFMGTCTYTIAKLCTNSSSLPYFNIEAKNENRGNAKVSYVQRVRVAVHGHSIWIVKEECHRVLVDGVWATLPVTLVDGRVRVSRSGKYVVLETDFGLAVSYDVDHSVEVKVPSTYSNQICGMCGNYNGMIKDDYMKPDGEQAKDSNELGNSWKVPPDAPGCDPVTPERCEPAEEKLYQSDAFCGLITSQQGPFAPCHSVINPDGAFESCVVELCLLAGSQDALCGSVETYADACQSAGVTIAPWRNSTFCAFHCAANSHYKQCASACPATCTDRFAPENCSKPCVEDCACNAGFVVSGSTCVPFENCGCVHNNKYNEKGAIFWEEGCQQRCRCTGNNRVVCETASCGAEEICEVQDGNLGCYRADTAKCHIYGDPHYTTFDGKLYHFQGACNYTVTETCGNTSVRFSVTSRNEHRGNPAWSAINSIALQFPDIHIAVRKNNLVYVDGVKVELPVRPHSSVNVKMEGSFVTVQTDFGVQLRFNGDHELFVVVDERYKGQLCGLCGTYTDDPLDDFLKPDGILAMDSTQFGNSWAVIDDDWPCNQSPPPPATCDPAAKEEAEEYCKIILAGSGPFKDCHWYIPPQLYFESCVYDHCASGGDSVLLCNALGAYASACETAGIVLGDWMEQSGCVENSCGLGCNFDSDLCTWTQSKTDDLDWKRISGSTPSAVTGPSYDHTSAGGYYIYIEGNEGREGDKAQLVSAPCNKTGDQCLRFWYHMYGVARSMALNVYQLEVGQPPVLMWSERGNKGNQWLEGAVELHLSGKAQIMIEAVRGNDYRSDVAVDDISFHSGCCGDNCDLTSTTSTPTPTSTTPPVTTESTCSVQGDPHYKTFDKQSHNFMGTCTYTLSKLCDASSALPYFNVEAANEHRSGNPYVSYVKHVNVNVYNLSIVLEKGHVVKVDGEVEVLPVRVMSGVHVDLSGKYVVVSTDFGLRVKFDGRHRADVTLPSVFKGKVCGMCGNYNDDRRDDFLNPDGVMEPDSVSLGNSWQSGNDTRCVPDVGTRPDCTDDERQMIESKSYCGIIVDPDSPFKACHSVVEPMAYFADCVYDLCALDLQTGSLCSSLQSYADACQSKGVRVEAWRNATFCPLKCGLNSHYEQCGSACPATCVNPNAPSSCSEPCVEGCLCDSGYVLYNDRCVRRDECGCWSEGKHYPVGSTFWTDDTCSTRCRCPSAGSKLVCWSTTCGTDSYCGVVNGVPGCYEQTYGICRVHNDPHYNTFDKATHHFMGTCTYTIAKLCTNSSSLPYFNIEAKNENRGNAKVSYVQRVRVAVHGHSIWIVKEECHRVLVDGVWATLPVTLVDGRVRVSRSGKYVVLETDFGLAVSYDVDHSVEVKVPSTYSNQICGMCGNYNGMIKDDYMKPDGEQAKDSNELGNSWKVPPDAPGCDPVTPERCEPAEEKLYQSDAFCGLITSQQGPFAPCHSVINPDGAFESCVVELCLLAGSQDALCGSVETYADACQSAGVTIAPWRNSTFCAFHCAANSHYKQCASACPATCTDRFAPENCSKPCVEDCACNAGFVVSGSTCVPFENCGCVHNNKYNEKGAIFWEEGCQQRCRCTGNNRVVCETASCGAEEICEVQDGNLGCYRADTAKCHIYGDPHYTTFDGKLYHFQGACNYTVTETCGNTSVRFSVTSRNEHRGNPAWSAINSIALQFPDIHIAVRKNNLVYVDGVKVELPVRPHSSVNVKMEGSFVTVQTDFGVQLRFNGDHELFVVVDERYKGQLCGLCGTYTDDPLDDFLKPDGILAMDSTQFGNSWAVIDDDWPCNQSPPPPATCDPAAKEEAEEYCKIILAGSGPFKDCHWYIPPQLYFESCVYDHCASGGDSVLLCNALGAYASACETAGVVLGDWMEQSGCVENSCGLGCNFDSDLCTWTQSKTDDLDWKRISGSTPSAVTGPSYDHTSAGGYYIYIEGNEGREGDKAQLVSAPCNKTGDQCLRFWYHMYGVARSMALNVYQLEVGQPPVLMWSERGNKGNQWLEGAVELHLSGKAQIMIEAVRGNDYRSDVAVDDISFQSGCCGDNCDLTSTTSTPTPTSTTPPVTTGHATCSVSGDPHYTTFDRSVHHFMGTCTYVLSKPCSDSSVVPYFYVSSTNEHRGTNTKVSWVKSVHVFVYNNTLSMVKNRKVLLNGNRVNLPVSVGNFLEVRMSGTYVLLETNFGLFVRFDGNHHVDVSVPSMYAGLLCGMCGNYNGDPADDLIMPNGSLATSSNELGESWQVPDVLMECNHGENDFKCDPEIKENAEKDTMCGMITNLSGLFKECHVKVPPQNYFENCVYDMCMSGGQSTTLCFAIQTYADLCAQAGVCIEWRNNSFCPLSCPSGSHYERCGTSCPATCTDLSAPDNCLLPTVEGCFCDPGYVLSVDQCVPNNQCGCVDDSDKYYQLNESWFTHENCTERCTCSGKNTISCTAWKCGVLEKCERRDGELGCHMTGSASCFVGGDPHYYTFDKIMYTFSGTCAYTLVKAFDNSNVVPVNITAVNEAHGQNQSTYLREIYIDVYGVHLTLQKNRRFLLNGKRTRTPMQNRLRGINVITNGIYAIVETDFGMSVKYDGNHNLEINLPNSYYSKVHGMCGNYNGQKADELLMPDGLIAPSVTHFGNSWKSEEYSNAGCQPDYSREQLDFLCTPEEKLIIESQCQELLHDKFIPCHHFVNPHIFIKNCIQDMCKYNGMISTLCDSFQNYVAACKEEGIEIMWRNSTFCPWYCPPNSDYTTCAPTCPPTCNSIYTGSSCDKSSVCVEGCVCDNGFVFSDDSCISVNECGCKDKNDQYHRIGETWLTQNCAQKCSCGKDGEINCADNGCESNENCSLKRNGQYICKSTDV